MRYLKPLRYIVTGIVIVLCAAALLWGNQSDFMSKKSDTQRIISIGGNVTEMIYAIGLGDAVVATDSTSTYPSAAAQLPKVGYMRTLSVEGVMSFNPTLLVLSGEAGPANVIEQLKATGVNIIQLPKAHTFENITASVSQIGAATGQNDMAAQLNMQMNEQWQAAQAAIQKRDVPLKALFIMSHTGSLTVAGKDTAADAVLQMAGLNNVARNAFSGYKVLDAESLLSDSPDVIVTTTESLTSMGGADILLGKTGIAQTTAAKNKQLIALPAMYLLGFGPRFGVAMQELNQRLQNPSMPKTAMQP